MQDLQAIKRYTTNSFLPSHRPALLCRVTIANRFTAYFWPTRASSTPKAFGLYVTVISQVQDSFGNFAVHCTCHKGAHVLTSLSVVCVRMLVAAVLAGQITVDLRFDTTSALFSCVGAGQGLSELKGEAGTSCSFQSASITATATVDAAFNEFNTFRSSVLRFSQGPFQALAVLWHARGTSTADFTSFKVPKHQRCARPNVQPRRWRQLACAALRGPYCINNA